MENQTPVASAPDSRPIIINNNQTRSKFSILFNILIFLMVVSVFLSPNAGGTGELSISEKYVMGSGPEKIALIPIEGVISSEPSGGGLMGTGPSSVEFLRKTLKAAGKANDVKGVILQINSPGGGVTASDIMYQMILDFKSEYQKPIIAHFGDISASGGYYIAAATDQIIAHPTTVTGSIGVVMQHMDFQELTDKVGVKVKAIKSSDKKDIGSSFRQMTPEEEQILQSIVQEMYQRFVSIVDKGRPNLTEAEVKALADGRIFTANQALKAGLVDDIGYLKDAVAFIQKNGKTPTSTVVQYHFQQTFLDSLAGAHSSSPSFAIPKSTPQFMYIWEQSTALAWLGQFQQAALLQGK